MSMEIFEGDDSTKEDDSFCVMVILGWIMVLAAKFLEFVFV